MDKVININGVEYIQKSEYDKAKKDADTIRQIVSSSIADLSNYVNNQSVAQSINQVFSQRSKHLQIRIAGQKIYNINKMTKDGIFFSNPNQRKLIFTIKDVLKINKKYNKDTTKKDVKKMADDMELPIDTIHRIIYNIDKDTFTKYEKEFLSDINTKIERKPAPVENNPEKRRESVLFST